MATASARTVQAGAAHALPAADVVSGPRSEVEALRAESRAALTRLVVLLRYPPAWADELERQSFAAGRVWSTSRRSPQSAVDHAGAGR